MGVKACDRRGCSGVMCDRLSNLYGYICDSCFRELVNSRPDTDIGRFMDGAHAPNDERQREQWETAVAQVFSDGR